MSTKSRSGNRSANSNQLSLFSEIRAELADNLIEESCDESKRLTSHHLDTRSWNIGDAIGRGWSRTWSARTSFRQAIFAAQELTGNLLYELTVVRKMDYQPAWEIATREWAFLPDEEDQPQLSFDPATLDPHQPLPAISA